MSGEKRGKRRTPAKKLLSAVMLFYFLAFFLLGLKDWSWQAFALSVLVPAIIFVGVLGLPKLFPADRLLLSLTNFLCALGVLVLYRLSPDRGLTQAVNFGVGIAAMMVCTLAVRYIKHWNVLAVLLAIGSLALLMLPILFGTEKNGAKNWISIGSFGFQPSEIVKLSLMIVISCWLAHRHVFFTAAFAGAALLILMLQKDLGTALLYYGVTMLTLYAATGSTLLVGLGGLGGAGAAVVGYQMFAHVRRRVSVWLNPWADYQNSGYQIVQGLIAIANGGLFGVGLGLGNASVIPESYNDYIFSVIAHEFGVVFSVFVLLIYLAIILRGVSIARQSDSAFHALLALSCSVLIGLQTFVIVGGNIKLIPLTGVTLPFISYGGTSMVSSLCVIGLLQGVAARNRAQMKEDKRLAMYGEEDAL